MAIDDNTSYELTGAQVKDLVNKIKGKAADNIFTGATSAVAGVKGIVPEPQAGDDTKFLSGDGTWKTVSGGSSYTAGNGISIDANNEISIDTTVVAEVSDLPTDFTGATSSAPGSNGLVPAPAVSDKDKFLRGDGTWEDTPVSNGHLEFRVWDDPNGTPQVVGDWDEGTNDNEVVDIHLPSVMTGATSSSAGTAGLAPAPSAGDEGKVLSGAGTWVNQPTVPTVNDATLTITQNGTSAGTFTANASSNATIALTDTTYSDFTGATSSTAGAHGLVPAPAAGDEGKALHGDGTWKDTTAKLVEMSYGESNAWAKFIAAYNAGSIVYCRASSNSNPATGTQGRKAFMAYVNNATTPTEVEFQYVRSVSSKTDSQQGDQVFIYKLTNASGGTWTVTTRNMSAKINVSGPITKTFTTGANATVTIGVDAMTGATGSAAGTAGVVPAPAAGSQNKFLRGDGTWVSNYAIHYDTFTATTDSNGFATVPTATVTPTTGMILAASSSSQQGFTTPFNDVDQSRFTIKTESWNRTAVGNTSVTYNIAYILY